VGLGLVYRAGSGDKGDKGGPFYPTPLLVELVSSPARGLDGMGDGGDGGGDGGRCVIVESNYRVYAYTSSLVQHAVSLLGGAGLPQPAGLPQVTACTTARGNPAAWCPFVPPARTTARGNPPRTPTRPAPRPGPAQAPSGDLGAE
jgi:hypothetical protein